jgi:hypothetical protein
MAILKIINNAEITVNGETVAIKQGASGSSAKTAFEITVSGVITSGHGTLTSGAGNERVIFDDDTFQPGSASPADFFVFWCDQNCYLQFVGSSTHCLTSVLAQTPYVMHAGTRTNAPTTGIAILGVATTTDIAAEPTLQLVDHILVGQYSGTTANYKWFAVG